MVQGSQRRTGVAEPWFRPGVTLATGHMTLNLVSVPPTSAFSEQLAR